MTGLAVLRARQFGMLCMRCGELTWRNVLHVDVNRSDHNGDRDKAQGKRGGSVCRRERHGKNLP